MSEHEHKPKHGAPKHNVEQTTSAIDEQVRTAEEAQFAVHRLLARQFNDLTNEWRRIIAEFFGTFLLVLAAAGASMVELRTRGALGHSATVTAPALTVAAVILMLGAVSGAHLNPVVTIAFALRREFPWKRIPAYIAAQTAGGLVACYFLHWAIGINGGFGTTVPMANLGDSRALAIEAVLTCGLVSTVLGTASGAQNIGPLSAFAVAGYIALAGLWASPLTGASMNPVRSMAPAIVGGSYTSIAIYIVGPLFGMGVAVLLAMALRGPGADPAAARAAQGLLGPVVLVEQNSSGGPDQDRSPSSGDSSS